MNDERDLLLRDYVLSAGAADDRALRETLEQACPDCSRELAEAEADLAAFAIGLPPVAPTPGGRERVLARIRSQRAEGARATPAPPPTAATAPGPNRAGPRPLEAIAPPSAAPAPRRLPAVLVAAALVAVGIALGLLTARQDARLEAMSRQVADLGERQRGTGETLTGIVDRLDRWRQLGERLREAESRLAQREREARSLADRLAVMRAADVVVPLAGAEAQPNAQGRLYYAKAQRRWLLTMSNLAPPAAGRCYELWFITATGEKIGSETFLPSASGEAEMMVDVPPGLEVAVAAITDEPLGGVAVPTGEVHLVGKL